MATATVTGTIYNADETPIVGEKVVFRITDIGTDGTRTYPRGHVSVTTDSNGQFSKDLWVNGDSNITSYYEIKTPRDEIRTVQIGSGLTSITLEELLGSHQIADPLPVANPIGITQGGTGATSAEQARINLGLGQGALATKNLDDDFAWTGDHSFAGTIAFSGVPTISAEEDAWRTQLGLGGLATLSLDDDFVWTGAQTFSGTVAFSGVPTISAEQAAWRTQLDVYNTTVIDDAFTSPADAPVSINAASWRGELGLTIGVDVQSYDADTAKLDVAQTWTAAQTFSGGITSVGANAATVVISDTVLAKGSSTEVTNIVVIDDADYLKLASSYYSVDALASGNITQWVLTADGGTIDIATTGNVLDVEVFTVLGNIELPLTAIEEQADVFDFTMEVGVEYTYTVTIDSVSTAQGISIDAGGVRLIEQQSNAGTYTSTFVATEASDKIVIVAGGTGSYAISEFTVTAVARDATCAYLRK